MALDKIFIGERLRRFREGTVGESRKDFAKRCNLTERHIGQLERGEFLISLKTLDKIVVATGVKADTILYGDGDNDNLNTRQTLENIISRAGEDDLQMYYKFITTLDKYVTDKTTNTKKKL